MKRKKNNTKGMIGAIGTAVMIAALVAGNILLPVQGESSRQIKKVMAAWKQEEVFSEEANLGEDEDILDETGNAPEEEDDFEEDSMEEEGDDFEEDTSDDEEAWDEDDWEEEDDNEDENKPEEEPEEPKLEKPVLKASSKPDGTIKISWEKVKGAKEYVLLCSTRKDGGFHKIYTAGAKTRYYMDKGRIPGKSYYYQLVAFSEGQEQKSKSKTVRGLSLEQVELTSISNVSGSRKLVLHWKPVKGADSYQIMRKSAKSGKFKTVATVKGTKTTYTDTERNGGTTYTYKVCAKDKAGGRGGYSTELSQMAIDKNKKMIALTYDDGPSVYTPVILETLEKYQVHATFFIVGNRVKQYAESVKAAAELGCEIGNHTYEHSILSKLNEKQIKLALSKTNETVKELAGVEVHLMRPPGGGYNSTVCDAADMPIIMWSIDTLDWKTRNTASTVQCVLEKANDGAIVLMHDLYSATANGAEEIVRKLKEKGYQLVTVSEMAAYRGGLEAGKAYRQFPK